MRLCIGLAAVFLATAIAQVVRPDCADDNDGLAARTIAMGGLACRGLKDAHAEVDVCRVPVNSALDFSELMQEFCQRTCEMCTVGCDVVRLTQECEVPEAAVRCPVACARDIAGRVGSHVPPHLSNTLVLGGPVQLMTSCVTYRAYSTCAYNFG